MKKHPLSVMSILVGISAFALPTTTKTTTVKTDYPKKARAKKPLPEYCWEVVSSLYQPALLLA
jgi:hypothetical protein